MNSAVGKARQRPIIVCFPTSTQLILVSRPSVDAAMRLEVVSSRLEAQSALLR